MKKTCRILITPGEPAGIGPDITLMAAGSAWPVELVALGDSDFLAERADLLGLSIKLVEWHPDNPAAPHIAGTLKILPAALDASVQAGHPNPDNAHQVVRCLEMATQLCLEKKADALVTGPVNKAIVDSAGVPFTGHTEFLATLSHTAQPVMLFVTDEMRVALLTTHLPLAKVPAAITADRLTSVLRVLHQDLRQRFQIPDPHIMVCGLNPHAGEEGLLGHEEQEIIAPTLLALQKEGLRLTGPVAADTVFTKKRLALADAILAMYHDQALPVVKYADFGASVNVTLGLPFIRTSVDHGVAFDAAGNRKADASSLKAAIRQAMLLATKQES